MTRRVIMGFRSLKKLSATTPPSHGAGSISMGLQHQNLEIVKNAEKQPVKES